MMVDNFAFSINKVKSEVQIPGLGVDDDARRAQLSFQMSARVCNPDSQISLVFPHKLREWVWRSKIQHSFYCHSTDSSHTSPWKITLGVTSAETPLRRLWIISYKHNCQKCSFPNKTPLKGQEHERIEAPAGSAAAGREAVQDEVSLVAGRGPSSLWYLQGWWQFGRAELRTSLGPGTTELGSEVWAVPEGGVALRNPRHRDPLALKWRQQSHQLEYHSIVFKRVWANFLFSFITLVFISSVIFSTYLEPNSYFHLPSPFFCQFAFFTLYIERETIKMCML